MRGANLCGYHLLRLNLENPQIVHLRILRHQFLHFVDFDWPNSSFASLANVAKQIQSLTPHFGPSARSVKSGSSPDVRHTEQWNKRHIEVTGTTSMLELYKRQPVLEDSTVYGRFYTKSGSASRSVAECIRDGEYRAGRKIKDFDTEFKLMGVSRKSKEGCEKGPEKESEKR
ncbi:hypothetical protein SUNI508_11300 [Seiridium unicorne]|uniref:Uncharacterized protein n=1 Tax=Seiridium unicorne TaxID=138068 RepID=A0ABR2UI79_9PEZI